MLAAFRHLDRLLRGETTRPDLLRAEGMRLPLVSITMLVILLAATYGACMGSYAVTSNVPRQPMQMAASAAKVPVLFVLSLLVTLPSLYVFNALVGSRLSFGPLLKMLIASQAVTMAVLASIGPIVAFFGISTSSYPFMVLLNVVVFAVSGYLGISFLRRTLDRLSAVGLPAPAAIASEEAPGLAAEMPTPSALDITEGALGRHTRTVFAIWILVFGLVGAQMAWILRPFIGAPGKPFTWLRPQGSNFFESVFMQCQHLFNWR